VVIVGVDEYWSLLNQVRTIERSQKPEEPL
jgi:hypothetical protein